MKNSNDGSETKSDKSDLILYRLVAITFGILKLDQKQSLNDNLEHILHYTYTYSLSDISAILLKLDASLPETEAFIKKIMRTYTESKGSFKEVLKDILVDNDGILIIGPKRSAIQASGSLCEQLMTVSTFGNDTCEFLQEDYNGSASNQ